MSESKRSALDNSTASLEFPSPGEISVEPIVILLDEIIRLSEERLPLVVGNEEWWEERIRGKGFKVFSL